jgi:hypothetical protein
VEDNHFLAVGQVLVADTMVACPKCNNAMPVTVRISIENLTSMSMLLWQHETPSTCPTCKLVTIPVITGFDTRAIKWQATPLLVSTNKPLIEVSGQIDVSKILKM